MEPVTLHTDRLELSPPVGSDVDAIFEACQDPTLQKYVPVPSPYLRTHAEEFIPRSAKNWADGVEQTWVLRDGETLAGMIGMYRIADGSAELGYWMSPGSRGQGLLTEAATAVVDWSFSADGLGLKRIEWRAVVGNVPSARAARTLGFRYEGLLRQGLVTRGTREDGWIAALLPDDARTPQPWPVLED